MNAPGLDLRPLKGDGKVHWGVTVKKNRRITFRLENGKALDMDDLDMTIGEPLGLNIGRLAGFLGVTRLTLSSVIIRDWPFDVSTRMNDRFSPVFTNC